MKKQELFPAVAFIWITIAGAGNIQAASNIKTAGAGNTLVYERTLNPYIHFTTDQYAVGNTYSIRDQSGKIVKTGVVSATKNVSVATGNLGRGIYTIQIGGSLLQQFMIK